MLMMKRNMSIKEFHLIYLSDLEIDFENEKLFPYPPNITNLLECIFIKLVSEEGRFSKFVEN
jgi:hypothetical protein